MTGIRSVIAALAAVILSVGCSNEDQSKIDVSVLAAREQKLAEALRQNADLRQQIESLRAASSPQQSAPQAKSQESIVDVSSEDKYSAQEKENAWLLLGQFDRLFVSRIRDDLKVGGITELSSDQFDRMNDDMLVILRDELVSEIDKCKLKDVDPSNNFWFNAIEMKHLTGMSADELIDLLRSPSSYEMLIAHHGLVHRIPMSDETVQRIRDRMPQLRPQLLEYLRGRAAE